MKNQLNRWKLWLAAITFLCFTACGEDDAPEPTKFVLQSLMVGTVDLNTSAAATNVPTDAPIKATFSTNVDPASATNTTVTLTKQGQTANVPANVTVTGAEVTLTPSATLTAGTAYTLSVGAMKSADGQTLPAMTKSFTTAGTAPMPGVIAHWSFNGNAADALGSFSAPSSGMVGITYGPDRKNQANAAAVFNGTTSIIEIPDGAQLINATNFTMSFWMKAVSTDHVDASGKPKAHFVFGLGAFHGLSMEVAGDYGSIKMGNRFEWADGTTGSNDFFFNGDGKNAANGGWAAVETRKDLTGSGGVAALLKDKWAHITFVFNSATKSRYLYINGELMEKDNFTLLPDTEKLKTVKGIKFNANTEVENKLALGFNQSRGGTLWAAEPWGGYNFTTANHFRGSLDEVRIFHTALTGAEVLAMYNTEK
ncbi:LamG-like jellyroll fold domain-containing protein [Rufibacter sp. XAAS-G3-1]|uniref:LamG-like jellyroll fold domain-containing protein n=1 Tax=Rufibacter sp. XAAS-G3-1 TaxID=2729134 RepID=UPI0015E7B989|nr:LamG-like jellyroll fold domain-containing protein [Rufibacter sp. XAAS-G3-1]